MNLAQAYLKVSSSLPSDEEITKRLDRAYDIVLLEGYEVRYANNCWIVDKASTNMLRDNSVSYTVVDTDEVKSCSCPDFSSERCRGGLCKHRLAVRLIRVMGEGEM